MKSALARLFMDLRFVPTHREPSWLSSDLSSARVLRSRDLGFCWSSVPLGRCAISLQKMSYKTGRKNHTVLSRLLSIPTQEKCPVPQQNVFSSVLVSFIWWRKEAALETVIEVSRSGEEEMTSQAFLGLLAMTSFDDL